MLSLRLRRLARVTRRCSRSWRCRLSAHHQARPDRHRPDLDQLALVGWIRTREWSARSALIQSRPAAVLADAPCQTIARRESPKRCSFSAHGARIQLPRLPSCTTGQRLPIGNSRAWPAAGWRGRQGAFGRCDAVLAFAQPSMAAAFYDGGQPRRSEREPGRARAGEILRAKATPRHGRGAGSARCRRPWKEVTAKPPEFGASRGRGPFGEVGSAHSMPRGAGRRGDERLGTDSTYMEFASSNDRGSMGVMPKSSYYMGNEIEQ